MPTGRDAELLCSKLSQSGVAAQECDSFDKLAGAVTYGAGAILIAEEALDPDALHTLVAALEAQPVWSDLPVIVFSSNSRNAEAILEVLGGKINATVVERPIRITMLMSAVKGALRARQRQYQTRDLLAQLEQSDKQKDLFLATLSHELRTPLNSILGWIQLLKSNSANLASIEHALDVIERNAKAQSEIISDILFVSRIVTGKLEVKREPLDLVAVVREAADIVRPLIETKLIDFEVSLEAGETQIIGDPDRLQQVFLNLLSNAVKFTGEQGRIVIRITREGLRAVVSVADTGIGIAPEFVPFVFERFRQADNTYTRRVGGLGLGLAIVRHLVELHGGQVSAESKGKGHGSVFTVKLPLYAAANNGGPPRGVDKKLEMPVDGAGMHGLHLMLVEDDDDSREMLMTFLESHAIKVTAVDSAAQALEELPTMRPDLLISDVGLPEQDGYDLIRAVRALPPEKGGRTPAIALTGYVSVQDRNQALASGFQEHMAKPINVDELLRMIRQLLREKAAA